MAKCVWMPTHKLQWLGFKVGGNITMPKTKLSTLTLTQKLIAARNVASIIDRIISMGLALGPIARCMTRSLYVLLRVPSGMGGYASRNPRRPK